MSPRDHLRAAARCWEHAGFFAAAAERYQKAEAWCDAGRCFSLAERHNDAAVAYSRADERLLAAREHLMAERPGQARRLYEGLSAEQRLSPAAQVELLLTLGKIEEASRITEDPTAMALFARLGASRNRADLAWPLRDEKNWQPFAPWNRSLRFHLPPSETETGTIWPSIEFSQVLLLPVWEEKVGGHSWGQRALDWSADGKFFVAALGDQGIARGRMYSDEVSLERWPLPGKAVCVTFLPKSSTVLAGLGDGKVCSLREGAQVQTVESLQMPGLVLSIAFSKQGDRLAMASNSKAEGKVRALFKVLAWQSSQPGTGLVQYEEIGVNGIYLLSCAWANNSGSLAWNPGFLEDIEEPMSSDHLRLLINQKERQVQNAHRNPMSDLRFAPDDRYLLSGSFDQTLVVRNGATGQALAPPERFNDSVLGVAIHPKAAMVAVGEGQRLHLLRLHPGEVPQLLRLSEQTFAEDVTSLAFSPDGRHLLMLTGRPNPHLRLFRVDLKP